MITQPVSKILAQVQTLPALPQAIHRLMALTEDPDVPIEEISKVIALDQTLTLKLLQMANSPFYGVSRQVSSISQAVLIMGLRGVRHLALGISVIGLGKRKADSAESMERFWRHSLITGLMARELAKLLHYYDYEIAFVAGLLHDIGKMVLMEKFPKEYQQVLKRCEKGNITFAEAEKEYFELDHAKIGAELCRYWNLPEMIIHAVGEHHSEISADVTANPKDFLASIIKIANALAKIACTDFSEVYTFKTDLVETAQKLKISFETLGSLLLELPSSLKEVSKLLDLKIPSPPPLTFPEGFENFISLKMP